MEQEFDGGAGLYRQLNVKKQVMSVREWAEVCAKEELRAPPREEAGRGRKVALSMRRPRTRNPRTATEPESEQEEDGDTVMRDPVVSLPTPPPQPDAEQQPQAESSVTASKRTERLKERERLDHEFLASFEPHQHWLPLGMQASDYTPEFCRALQWMYWRNCGLGEPWYGARVVACLRCLWLLYVPSKYITPIPPAQRTLS
ncbi:hypothetical protein M422DRAFT_779299 [Sphaerobolus stellatus SS14]|uniref:Uncharacterized protein n=1 Tax=Sphaerobolus stellatus (strain SS14) TaxID=990650 RepID=A0A0C9W0R7_SPHS4|nr:hypothetical protein M422DRAFT_779299 [Sphaerobolus stellatus SS14]